MAEETKEQVQEVSTAIVVKKEEPQSVQGASLQAYFTNEERFPGLVYDPRKKSFPQIKAWIKRRNPMMKAKDITTAAEKIIFEDLKMYTDSEVTRLIRDYRAELPKYSKAIDPFTGEALKVDVTFVRKAGLGMTMDEFFKAVKDGDPRAVAYAQKVGFKGIEPVRVHDVQS
jgi:hypothetical protein